jgi:hypothetical protein
MTCPNATATATARCSSCPPSTSNTPMPSAAITQPPRNAGVSLLSTSPITRRVPSQTDRQRDMPWPRLTRQDKSNPQLVRGVREHQGLSHRCVRMPPPINGVWLRPRQNSISPRHSSVRDQSTILCTIFGVGWPPRESESAPYSREWRTRPTFAGLDGEG